MFQSTVTRTITKGKNTTADTPYNHHLYSHTPSLITLRGQTGGTAVVVVRVHAPGCFVLVAW
jgi:hypothetical protein